MKTTIITLLSVIAVSGLLLSAAAQPAGAPDENNNATDAVDQAASPNDMTSDQSAPEDQATQSDQNTQDQGALDQAEAGAQETQMQPAQAGERSIRSTVIRPRGPAPRTVSSDFPPPAHAVSTNYDDLSMNFVNAPLNQVLSYLSDAAGFIIVRDTRANINGFVTIQGKHITRDEAVDLLNSQLNQNNLAAIRNDRILTIVNKSDAKTAHIPVRMGRKTRDLCHSGSNR